MDNVKMTSKEANSLIGYTVNVRGCDLVVEDARKMARGEWMFWLSDGSIKRLSEMR